MRKSFVALLLALGATPLLAVMAFGDDYPAKLMNAQMAQEMRSRAAKLGTSTHVYNDTTFVGYNPAFSGNNYWSVGVGHRHPRGAYGAGKGDILPVPDDDTGYWDWDHPVHGDSLQGWWPVRHPYTRVTSTVTTPTDDLRPWHAIDIGNEISYVINQGNPYRRTFGVTAAWHRDPGRDTKIPAPGGDKSDVNPNPPRWIPIGGSYSAWCGLRAHGDYTVIDAVTGNPYNVDALEQVSIRTPTLVPDVAAGGTNRKFPGYAGQWDQMLYRDIDITNATTGANVSVSFNYRTRMSTGKETGATRRIGWFDKDPISVIPADATIPNFISSSAAGASAPIDSFMVYVGCPVVDTVGAEWTGSDGNIHTVFDPVRRWFGELIHANRKFGGNPGYYELFTTYGNNPALPDSNGVASQTATGTVTYGQLLTDWGATSGNKIRLVFRIKTNRGSPPMVAPSDDADGSASGAYSSAGLGAAELDDVQIDLGSGMTAVAGGTFENAGDIDNASNVSASDAWKTSSKPPAIFHHVHDMTAGLTYEDLCGSPGSPARTCDLAGNVVSMGDHDASEAFSGASGTAEAERHEGMFSPTINLAYDSGNPTSKNNMGLDAGTAVPNVDFCVIYNIYTGGFDLFNLGSGYQFYFQSYPAEQSDGTRMWGEPRFSRFQNFNPDKQCYEQIDKAGEFGQVFTTNPGGQPDSVRIGLRKITQCYIFPNITGDLCQTTLGGYWDNVSLAILDGVPTPPISSLIWELFNDTFPANESTSLPGTAAFDTCAALIKGGLQTAPGTGDLTRYVVPADTLQLDAAGDSVEVQLKFRILPGPGNYVVPGDRCSGLRAVPSDTTRISPTDNSFWTAYILNPGKEKDPPGFPEVDVTGDCKGIGNPLRHDQRWSEFVWCNARMDTTEQNLFPVSAANIGNLPTQSYATMYHEDDKHLAALGISRHKCFVIDTTGTTDYTNITCSDVPEWVTAGGAPYKTGYDGNEFTVEGTKILPDGLLTPGSHVEYYFESKDLLEGTVALNPDTSLVFPQDTEGSLDAHRWQEFSVLPDAWKFSNYGGLGQACLLYVDWNDRRGNERVWVSVADSIGATGADKHGAHNGWFAPSEPKDVDINDAKWHVDKNAQPGTTWDMYGIKASESLTNTAHSIGARFGYRGGGTLLTDKWAKNAPTITMLEAYYRVLMILTGDLNSTIVGPYPDRSSDDERILREFMIGATEDAHRGIFFMGDGFMEATDADGNTELQTYLGASLQNKDYFHYSGNPNPCIDLIPQSMITSNGDVYGVRNTCLFTLDVLKPTAGGAGVPSSLYDPEGANPINAPYVSGVFLDAVLGNTNSHWQALTDGWNIFNLRSKQCAKTHGRLVYFWNVYTNVFSKVCTIVGAGPQTTEVPNNSEGKTFVDFAGIGNNPLRQGSAVIHLTLAKADRVTVKIYDVSGRLVRTLSDGQLFKAGKVDPALTWDGLDNNGRQVARGAYFVSVRYANSRYENNKKMIVLK